MKSWSEDRDDPKLPDDSEEVFKLNRVVGGSILGRETVSLLDEKLVRWSKSTSGLLV